MKRLTKKKVKQVRDDNAYWHKVQEFIPDWRVVGWTFRSSAIFDTGNSVTLELTGSQYEQLMTALRGSNDY